MIAPWLLLLTAAGAAAPVPSAAVCAQYRLHDHAAQATACYQTLAAAADPELRAEGDLGLGLYADANAAFRAAVARADARGDKAAAVRARVGWGRLLQARFNDADAEGLFNEALQRDPDAAPAYLGLALISADGFDGKALDYARRAASLDPKLAEADVLLAALALEDSDPATAATEAARALEVQPDDLDAMAVQAAIAVLAAKPPDDWLQRIAAINPHYGHAEEMIGDQLVLNRRYAGAAAWYRKAVALTPDLWSAHSALGIDLMRLGQVEEPRKELTLAYSNDYRDIATVNTLRLLDTLQKFDTVRDGNIILKLDPKEAPVLTPYFEALIQRALATYGAKYHVTLPGPVQVEAYPNHADFAVRSVGLPGLGALGVTFGTVVAMDSPSARPPGEFNWATTLWHELDHVFVLTATANLVPRWFAEGLAVHEETQADPEWGDRITPDVLVAIHDGKLLPIAELDRGFIHPTYAGQVNVSYYQAGRVCDFIQSRWGPGMLVNMVQDFAAPTTTPAVLERALQLSPAAFDAAFHTWLLGQLGPEVNNFNAWRTALKAMVAAKDDTAQVIQYGEQARALYPEYIYDANPYGFLAHAYLARNDTAAALRTLTAYEHEGGLDPELLKQLAAMEPAATAAATLERINNINPMDPELHARLGELDLELKKYPAAIREFTARVALRPADVAGAQYDLARAYFAAGNLDAAQTAVIAALVAAHDFRPAQDLLEKIMSAKH